MTYPVERSEGYHMHIKEVRTTTGSVEVLPKSVNEVKPDIVIPLINAKIVSEQGTCFFIKNEFK